MVLKLQFPIMQSKQFVREGLGENMIFSGTSKSKNQYFYWVNFIEHNTIIHLFDKPMMELSHIREDNGQLQLIDTVEITRQSIICLHLKPFMYTLHRMKSSKNPDLNLQQTFSLVCITFSIRHILINLIYIEEIVIEVSFFTINILIIECARNYTQPQGRIYGKALSNCESFIDVPENYTITLYFATFDTRLSGECTENNTPLKVSCAVSDQL